ncbi:protein decapping 5 [Daucus carota subsp. sativus]|uniref:Sm domain-containing protein n=1 Tax=Daucus carota subsp. sativus TaxID=79200 RepID=A0A166EKF2_DAUCS|nr:PREDICTED: protein decapping 5-like [Daucus carota subsp. sativus]
MAMEGSSRFLNLTSAAADTYAYIGMQISITSKSEIRYEGILVNLNTQESTLALNNVKSFGTEGRKKGPQIPPSDQIYEYILFRGSDIKDLQVKSSPLIQTTTSIYNDPAIIQLGLPKSAPESSVPIYQPGGSCCSCGSLYPYSTTNDYLSAPVYIKGFQAPSDGFQTQQQSLLQPPSGFLALPSVHQTIPYPSTSASIPNRSSNAPASPLLDTMPPLLPSFSPVTPALHSLFPLQSSALPTDLSTLIKPNTGPIQGLHSDKITTTSLQLVTPPRTILDESAFSTGSFLNRGLTPPLVTPDQFLQPATAVVSSNQSSQSVQNNVHVSFTERPLQTLPGAQAPILPLPTSLDYKASNDVINFTEDFDIVSINEKFSKLEVGDQLDKMNSTQEGYFLDQDNVDHVGKTTSAAMPVYVEDDFFQSPSSNFSGRSRRGRSIFSEEKKSNRETFASSAHRGGHCGRGHGHSGHDHSGDGPDSGDHGLSLDGYGCTRVGRRFGHWRHSRDGRRSRRSYGYNERRGWGHHAT